MDEFLQNAIVKLANNRYCFNILKAISGKLVYAYLLGGLYTLKWFL